MTTKHLYLIITTIIIAITAIIVCIGYLSSHTGNHGLSPLTSSSISENNTQNQTSPSPTTETPSNTSQPEISIAPSFKLHANRVITAIKDKDFEELANYISSTKGVRFSPYANVNVTKDKTFTATEVAKLWQNATSYTWGTYDGSGEPIALTFRKYYEQFIYSQDFAHLNATYDNVVPKGNIINTITEVYPNAHIVTHHFTGTVEMSNMDWQDLHLVFQQEGDIWYLVGIVHDQWTI